MKQNDVSPDERVIFKLWEPKDDETCSYVGFCNDDDILKFAIAVAGFIIRFPSKGRLFLISLQNIISSDELQSLVKSTVVDIPDFEKLLKGSKSK